MTSRRQKILRRISPKAVAENETYGLTPANPKNPLDRGVRITIPLGGSKHEKVDLGRL